MDNLHCSVHFLTLKQIGYEESNAAVTFYHDRTHFDQSQRNLYAQYAEEFHLQQGRQFTLHNRIATAPHKISKLKDQVKEFDSLFQATPSTNHEMLTNNFPSSQNSIIAKQIWLTPTNILLIMQDGVLAWLLIDSISGDLIKILIDKSLLSNNSFKLSGSLICDCALLSRSEPTILILAYSDKSAVDLITLNKQFAASLNANKEKLEKLNNYEPSFRKVEFSCPSLYRIEKRLSILNEDSFILWWPNDGQIVWQPESQIAGISLLERDDLRNNILLVNTQNFLEQKFKSDGLLLSVHYLNKKSLIAVEQTECNSHKYTITIFRYDLPFETIETSPEQTSVTTTLKIKLTQFQIDSKIGSIEQIKTAKKYLLMLTQDQTLILFDLNRNIVNKFKFNNDKKDVSGLITGIEWLLDDLLFVLFDLNGELFIFDIGFNQLTVSYMTKYPIKFKSLSEYLNPNLFAPFKHGATMSGNRFVKLVAARRISKDSLWASFYFGNGPFGLFRLSLHDEFNQASLVTLYLKNAQFYASLEENNDEKVFKCLKSGVGLMSQLDWDREADICLACLFKILNFFLSDRVEFSLRIEQLIEQCLAGFYRPKRALLEKTIYANKHRVSRYARRFFFKLVENGSLGKAFLLAVDIGAKDLFNDLYYCALDKGERQMSEVCRKKYHEVLAEERKAKFREEANRSVTTIDDNIKGAVKELDRLSVSESGDDELSNLDNESNGSLEDYESFSEELDLACLKDKGNKLKIYTEEEIENYAKQLFMENKFVHRLNFENFN